MGTYNYIGTVTFNSYHDTDKKWVLVKKFPELFSQHLRHSLDTEYILIHTIEYHKVGNEDDPEAPHIHFILESNRKIGKCYFNGITKMFQQIYGRTQFYLATKLKLRQWATYIVKDVQKNDTMHNTKHYYETRLENNVNHNEVDDFIDDEYIDL